MIQINHGNTRSATVSPFQWLAGVRMWRECVCVCVYVCVCVCGCGYIIFSCTPSLFRRFLVALSFISFCAAVQSSFYLAW